VLDLRFFRREAERTDAGAVNQASMNASDFAVRRVGNREIYAIEALIISECWVGVAFVESHVSVRARYVVVTC
jgi:hypothetical protein